LIRDHRPYFVKRAYLKFQAFYTAHYLRPQFDFLGASPTFMKPWHVELFGLPIRLGDCANVIAAPDGKVRLSVWSQQQGAGRIVIGNHCLICPGVRIGSACEVVIGDDCMLASRAYVTDSDWHDIYNRITAGRGAPVRIENNVWIGDSAIVCKGTTIGENSIIGAGAVVSGDIPANVVAAGNPARIVKRLDPEKPLVKRAEWFADPVRLNRQIDQMDREMLKKNSLFGWLRHLLFPAKLD
jgi:acetyltransferase-like isoleucine patch superfamily enzyme